MKVLNTKLICDKCGMQHTIRERIPQKYYILRCNFCPDCSPNRPPSEYRERFSRNFSRLPKIKQPHPSLF